MPNNRRDGGKWVETEGICSRCYKSVHIVPMCKVTNIRNTRGKKSLVVFHYCFDIGVPIVVTESNEGSFTNQRLKNDPSQEAGKMST